MNVIGTLILLLGAAVGLVMTATRRVRLVGLAILTLSAGLICFFMWQSSQRYDAFESVALGASEAAVVAALGDPPRVTDGSEWVEAGYKRSEGELIPGCVREYWYSAFFYPEKLSLCFDSSGVLIHKYRYTSW
jgi:hypothetical protein